MKNTFINMGMAKPFNWSNINLNFWLAGFIEGEGSVSISVKFNQTLKYLFQLQPEFNVVQHVSGLHI